MIEFDPARCRMKPFRHQTEGTKFLLSRASAALFDEQGVAKSKQVIDAACVLWEAREIDTLVIICPASVRGQWDSNDENLPGEILKHCYVPHFVARFDTRRTTIDFPPPSSMLSVVVTNYEFIRADARLKQFLKLLKGAGRYMLVLDESDAIKSRKAKQTKAAAWVRNEAKRFYLLSGTPVANNLMDLWAPLSMMDPASVHGMNFWQFRYRYAIMGGWQMKQVVGYKTDEVEKLKVHLNRWVIRREKKDCLDLPPKLYERVEVPLSEFSYKLYTEMRDEMVIWAESGDPLSIAPHGAVKVLRLAQICAGFLGTGEEETPATEIGNEKLTTFMEWQKSHPETMIVWCRFRPERKRLVETLNASGRRALWIAGGQGDKHRQQQLQEFKETPGSVLVGQPQAGGRGLNLQVATTVVYMSNDYSLVSRLQSEDRAHRAGQKGACTYYDFLATTPKGRQTIDHVILKALLKKESLADWTYDRWVKALKEE